MSHQLDVTFELITPAYAGSAEQADTDGLRPPTLKALLRFWWRTLHPELSSNELFERESQLFGSATTGQGLRVVPSGPIKENEEVPAKYEPGEKIRKNNNLIPNATFPLFYMAYGTQGDNNTSPRKRTRAGSTYSYRLISKSNCSTEEWHEIISALWLLTTFGGIGTRSRRGFGSLQVKEIKSIGTSPLGKWEGLPDITVCANTSAVHNTLQLGLNALFPTKYTSEPEHTAFSSASKIVVGPSAATWEEALIAAGKTYYQLRRLLGTSFRHTQNGEPVGEDFRRIVSYRATVPTAPRNPYTFGASFGLPHNYQFSDRWKPALEVFTPEDIQQRKDKGSARRASPLMFRIIKLANRHYVPIILWLPSRFLPSDYQVRFVNGRRTSELQPRKVNIIAALFYPKTQLDGWVDNVKQPVRDFVGYPGQPGWQEVKW